MNFPAEWMEPGILKLSQQVPGNAIRAIDWTRGIARYPQGMLGRQNPVPRLGLANTGRRILIVAAHPDDEVIGLGSVLARHAAQGDTLVLIFVTNGRGPGWFTRGHNQRQYVLIRSEEVRDVGNILGIPSEHLGFLGFPDGNLIHYMKPLFHDLEQIYRAVQPNRVYVQGLEGGHIDHDVTSLVAQTVMFQMGFSHVWEWAEYNSRYDVADPIIDFPAPTPSHTLQIPINSDSKKRLLAAYHSQPIIGRVSDHAEVVRKATPQVLVSETRRFYGEDSRLGRELHRLRLTTPSRRLQWDVEGGSGKAHPGK